MRAPDVAPAHALLWTEIYYYILWKNTMIYEKVIFVYFKHIFMYNNSKYQTNPRKD